MLEKTQVTTSHFQIELRQVTIQFGSNCVLKNLSLGIHQQSSLVFVGPSGHGKTVLLKALSGLIPPSSGQLIIEGQNFHQLALEQQNKILKKMGMLFQKNALFDSFTCGENIAFPLKETSPFLEKEIQEKVDFFLDAVGISHAKNLYPDEISGGMQKRLGIARALALNPQIIFYDDPTAGLDPITSRKIIDLILKLKKENNSTIITITNDMNRAFQLAGEIGMVVNTELIMLGTKEAALRHTDPRVQQFLHGSPQGPLMALS